MKNAEENKLLCQKTMEINDIHTWSGTRFVPCGRPAKYLAKFKDGVRGEMVEECLCGVHSNALEKNSKRQKKRMHYDNNLVITLLTNTP